MKKFMCRPFLLVVVTFAIAAVRFVTCAAGTAGVAAASNAMDSRRGPPVCPSESYYNAQPTTACGSRDDINVSSRSLIRLGPSHHRTNQTKILFGEQHRTADDEPYFRIEPFIKIDVQNMTSYAFTGIPAFGLASGTCLHRTFAMNQILICQTVQ